jgi:hypothetical protein
MALRPAVSRPGATAPPDRKARVQVDPSSSRLSHPDHSSVPAGARLLTGDAVPVGSRSAGPGGGRGGPSQHAPGPGRPGDSPIPADDGTEDAHQLLIVRCSVTSPRRLDHYRRTHAPQN